jgi:carboxypeptidase Taq
VILRYDLEKKLIEGTLNVKDVPDAWNAGMKSLLGIIPKKASEGCLQDIHWSMGAFGYFPTYALGTMYAAQLFATFTKTFPDWEKRISSGNLTFITEWLRNSIHKHGRQYNSRDLIKHATGASFDAKAFVKYLKGKY